MVRNVARSDALRAQVGNRSKARTARGVGGLRVAHGMEPARADGLGNTAAQQRKSWQEGWDLDAQRFGIHKTATDDDEPGEQWSVIDYFVPRFVAVSARKADAQLVADALEYLSHRSVVDEFEAAQR